MPAAEVDPNEIRILLSTDNHLGYLEKDPLRGDDSFRAFEEVLALATANSVDMLLLGGDLFHDNKPSRRTMIRAMRLLRKHCIGDDAVHVAVRSDQNAVNFYDPNYNISLPVFMIHGNHDDCTGAAGSESLSALDLLAEANLITYFGKAPDTRKVNIKPILLQKGRTSIALYGLGNIRDDVLYETWMNAKQVHWMQPRKSGSEAGQVDWFSMFVIHQNRAVRGTTKAIAETMLPKFLDYVLWGHEHDSRPELTATRPPVVQPGSTVATSLSEGEALPKHAVLLEVRRGKMKHRAIPLQTVRAFEFGEVVLGDAEHALGVADKEAVEQFLTDKLDEMIERQEKAFDEKRKLFESGKGVTIDKVRYPSAEFYLAHLPRELRQPLIRLRVEYSGGYETFSSQKFGRAYVGRVACAGDMLLFFKRRKLRAGKLFLQGHVGSRSRDAPASADGGANGGIGPGEDDGDERYEGAVDGGGGDEAPEIPRLVEYFLYHKQAGGAGLNFLELDKLSRAVDDFVAKNEPRAISDYVAAYQKVQQDSTLEKQTKRGQVLTETELNAAFLKTAKEAADRVLGDQKKKNEMAREKAGKKTEMKSGGDIDMQDGSADRQGDMGGKDGDSDGGGDDGPNEQKDDARQSDDNENPFAHIDAILHRNAKTAPFATGAGAQALMLDNEGDEEEDGDEDDIAPARPAASRGRGAARKKAAPRTKAKAPPAARRPPAAKASARAAPQARPSSRPPRRSAARAPASYAALDVDEDDGDQGDFVAEEVEEEEEVVVRASRKRRAPAASARERPRSRQRTETIDLDDSDD